VKSESGEFNQGQRVYSSVASLNPSTSQYARGFEELRLGGTASEIPSRVNLSGLIVLQRCLLNLSTAVAPRFELRLGCSK
jgi:hypothetical protein